MFYISYRLNSRLLGSGQNVLDFCFTRYFILDQILYMILSCVHVSHPLLSMYLYVVREGISSFSFNVNLN